MAPIIILIVIGVIVLAVVLGKAHAERERQRKAALAAWAQASGFAYYEKDPFNLDARYDDIGDIGSGHNRYAFEVLYRADPVETFIFQYHYQTTETRTVTHTDSHGHSHTRTETYEQDHWRKYLVIELRSQFPDLSIRPEGWGDKLAGFLGFDDIDFESEQFSSRYFVKSADRQFAYAVIHPQTMEWLMDKRFAGRLERGMMVMDVPGSGFTAEGCHAGWALAAEFIDRIPQFVWQDYGKTGPVSFGEAAIRANPYPAAGQ